MSRYFLVSFLILAIALLAVYIAILLAPEVFDPLITALVLFFILFVFLYFLLNPYIRFIRRGDLIDRDMHLFITRMGVLSTSEGSRKEMFEILMKMKEYGELSTEFGKIYVLVSKWNVSLEKAARTVADQTPSVMLSDFLLRLAHAVETGESAEEFFKNEQTVVMEEYSIRYKGSIRSVEVLSEVFISTVVILLMVLVMLTFMPFLTGEDIYTYLLVMTIVFIVIEVSIMYILDAVVPGERIWHDMDFPTEAKRTVNRKLRISIVMCLIVLTVMLLFPYEALPFKVDYFVLPLFIMTVAVTPLLLPAIYVEGQEMDIKRRDEHYPAFIRSLGGAVGARSKSIILPLKKLRSHDFGPLTNNVKDLYKRLATRIKSRRAWEYFHAETLSELISKFNEMYVEGARIGGDTKRVSRIISENFIRITGLRKMKYETSSTFTWMLYGLAVAMSFILYFGLYIVRRFHDLFIGQTLPQGVGEVQVLESFRQLDLLTGAQFNFDYLLAAILAIVVIHCVLSAIMTRVISGGHKVGALTHFVGMMWLTTITAILVSMMSGLILI